MAIWFSKVSRMAILKNLWPVKNDILNVANRQKCPTNHFIGISNDSSKKKLSMLFQAFLNQTIRKRTRHLDFSLSNINLVVYICVDGTLQQPYLWT